MVKTSVTHLLAAYVQHICFYHILMTSVIYYYLNRRMATWNPFVKPFQTMWFNL